ncbi:MAG: superoxide dismutase [Solirubrobacteraceae bacterium]
MFVRILTVAALLCAAITSAAVARPFPETIPLPDGFQPEGIDVGRGNAFFVGSIPTGAIYRGDLRTGEGDVLVPGRSGRAAIGLKVDRRNRLFVAGGPTGKAFVYSARDGSDLGEFVLTEDETFVNDVTLARGAAYFTDSINQQLYVLRDGDVETLPLTGDLQYDDDPGTFELNGIAATRNGKRLIAVQSRNGKLFEIDPQSGVTDEIDLGGESVPNGDGLLLAGRRLYVVQNRLNQVAVVDLRRGEIVRHITDDDFDVPTTIARKGRWLWAPNARFGTPPGPDVEYDVVRVSR